MKRNSIYMADYVEHLDRILSSTGEKVLEGSGNVIHAKAIEKAKAEYKKYQAKTLSPVEKAYLQTIKGLEKQAKSKVKNNK